MTKPKFQAEQDLVMALVKMRANNKYVEEKLILSIDSEEVLCTLFGKVELQIRSACFPAIRNCLQTQMTVKTNVNHRSTLSTLILQ